MHAVFPVPARSLIVTVRCSACDAVLHAECDRTPLIHPMPLVPVACPRCTAAQTFALPRPPRALRAARVLAP